MQAEAQSVATGPVRVLPLEYLLRPQGCCLHLVRAPEVLVGVAVVHSAQGCEVLVVLLSHSIPTGSRSA